MTRNEPAVPGLQSSASNRQSPVSLTLALVDDDDDVRRAVSRLLRAIGHQVRTFTSAEAFEAAAVEVDCAIVDVRLPGLNGFELRERMRKRLIATPIVLITGDGDRLAADLARAIDTPLVTKPFDDAALSAAIRVAMSPSVALHGKTEAR